MKKNQKILGTLLLIAVTLLSTMCKPKTANRDDSNSESFTGTTLSNTDSLTKMLFRNTITLGTLGQKIVLYRITNNVSEPTYVKVNSYPDALLGQGLNYIYLSPNSSYNGSDSLITTFTIYSLDANDDIIATQTKVERIICPPSLYFGTLGSGSPIYYGRKNGPSESNVSPYFPVIKKDNSGNIIVTWPPTYR